MSLPDLKKALNTKLASLSPSIATQWQNMQYDPVEGTPWQRATVRSNPNHPLGITEGSGRRWTGEFYIVLFYPRGKGSGAADARAQALMNHFTRGLNLVTTTMTVVILEPFVMTAVDEPNWFRLPVQIPFFANEMS
jgi:hypothetical protein